MRHCRRPDPILDHCVVFVDGEVLESQAQCQGSQSDHMGALMPSAPRRAWTLNIAGTERPCSVAATTAALMDLQSPVEQGIAE